MPKIRKVHINGHPILGDLNLDFCGPNGRAVDTVILAGENGAGKSTIMGLLYDLVSGNSDALPFASVKVEFEEAEAVATLVFTFEKSGTHSMVRAAEEDSDRKRWVGSDEFKAAHPMSAIYSDVDINFSAGQVSTVTSLTLDSEFKSRKSSGDLPTKINQLLIDVQDLDDADVAYAVRSNPGRCLDELCVEERMPRFTHAFETMFDDLRYDRVDNRDGHKEIVFKKHGREVPIGALSSGEKQIVYRGCFLLKDVNATKGAFVFIDEPEISLHPTWQQKVMDYYKAMFTDSLGRQTSQIFCVTHSPFIVHNDRRRDDKVIVLKRTADGGLRVEDKPEYYWCDSMVAVKDAFSIRDFSSNVPTVYLEGRTDEKYFTKALELFGYSGSVRFKWVGHLDANGQERCTGAASLNSAYEFLSGLESSNRSVFLFDSDTKRKEERRGNVLSFSIPHFENAKKIKKGIENALVLDEVDTSAFYRSKEIEGDYGEVKSVQEFKKMEFCEFICSKGNEELGVIFRNLKPIIDKAVSFLKGEE